MRDQKKKLLVRKSCSSLQIGCMNGFYPLPPLYEWILSIASFTPPQWAVQCMYRRYNGTPDGRYNVCTVDTMAPQMGDTMYVL